MLFRSSSEGITDADVKKLVDNLLANATAYKKFRVGEYEAYMTTSTLRNNLKISSQYNNYENPTGVYLKAGESCVVVASGIGEYSVGVKIKNWVVNESSSAYSLRNGLNVITAQTEGNVFVNYYTDDFENAPNVKVHFVNAPVQGYWDQETMTNDDWKALLKNRASNDMLNRTSPGAPEWQRIAFNGKQQPTEGCRLRLVSKRLL